MKTTEQQYELINKLNKAMEGREIVAVDGPYPYPNGDDQVLLRLKAKPRPFDVPVQLVTKDGWAKEDVLITILPVNNGFVYHLDGSNFIYQGEQKNGRKILRQS